MSHCAAPRTRDGRPYDYLDLAAARNDELEAVMNAGTLPDVRSLAGWEWKGFNTLDLTTVLGFRKFKKGFRADAPPPDARARIQGYNVKIRQNGLAGPWEDVVKNGRPVRHGFFDVYPVEAAERDNLYPNALLLNYACGRNPVYDPSVVLRDYLVQVSPDNPDLLLGKAYLALGPKRLFVSYFVLGRHNKGE
jgi:hypothetical protein